jgi:hypothetical protein
LTISSVPLHTVIEQSVKVVLSGMLVFFAPGAPAAVPPRPLAHPCCSDGESRAAGPHPLLLAGAAMVAGVGRFVGFDIRPRAGDPGIRGFLFSFSV